MQGESADIIIAGGGISGALAALALAEARPDLRLMVIEASPSACSGRLWPCFLSDFDRDARQLVEPLFEGAWRKYEVRFPRFMRVVNTACRMISGDKIDAALRAVLPEKAVITGVAITCLDAAGATLADGRRIHASAVIDARGGESFPHLVGGWRESLGRLVRFERKHPFAHPLLMDLRVPQRDGCRYFSCVPMSAYTLLVSEVDYCTTPERDPAKLAARINEYCTLANWQVAEVLGEQYEVTPLVAAGDFDAFWAAGDGSVARIGLWAGLFHPFTGSQAAPAANAALWLAAAFGPAGLATSEQELSGPALARASRDIAREHWRRTGFERRLVRLMFGAARANRRYKMFERLCRLDEGLIERFYAGNMRWRDQIKVLLGKLPVPVGNAVATLLGRGYPLTPLDSDASQSDLPG